MVLSERYRTGYMPTFKTYYMLRNYYEKFQQLLNESDTQSRGNKVISKNINH